MQQLADDGQNDVCPNGNCGPVMDQNCGRDGDGDHDVNCDCDGSNCGPDNVSAIILKCLLVLASVDGVEKRGYFRKQRVNQQPPCRRDTYVGVGGA